MITNFDNETATIILPIIDLEYSDLEYINSRLGMTLVEVCYETESFTKFNVDYSLYQFDDAYNANGEQESTYVYEYLRNYFGIDTDVVEEDWERESTAYLEADKADTIKFYEEWIAETKAEVPGERYTQEEIDARIVRLTDQLNEELAA